MDNIEAEIYGELNLQNVYIKCSVNANESFEYDENISKINDCFQKIFKPNFLKIDSTELVKDGNLLNIRFIELLKHCSSELKFKQPHIIFIAYCDYFNMPYNAVYCELHEKLQTIIKNGYISMIGVSAYKKVNKRINPVYQNNLFDLLK